MDIKIIKKMLRHYPAKTISIINNCGGISIDDIKEVEKILIELGVSCSVIDGQIHLGGN